MNILILYHLIKHEGSMTTRQHSWTFSSTSSLCWPLLFVLFQGFFYFCTNYYERSKLFSLHNPLLHSCLLIFCSGNAPSADGLHVMDISGINSGCVDRAAGEEKPPLKHSKLYVFTVQLLLISV